jgi:hypothetical protein
MRVPPLEYVDPMGAGCPWEWQSVELSDTLDLQHLSSMWTMRKNTVAKAKYPHVATHMGHLQYNPGTGVLASNDMSYRADVRMVTAQLRDSLELAVKPCTNTDQDTCNTVVAAQTGTSPGGSIYVSKYLSTSALNTWQSAMSYTCPNQSVMVGLKSDYESGEEDREWQVQCGHVEGVRRDTTVDAAYVSTGNVKDDQTYTCPQNTALIGVSSTYVDGDRVWKVKCSRVNQAEINPEAQDWVKLGELGANMRFSCPSVGPNAVASVMTALKSSYISDKKDREYYTHCSVMTHNPLLNTATLGAVVPTPLRGASCRLRFWNHAYPRKKDTTIVGPRDVPMCVLVKPPRMRSAKVSLAVVKPVPVAAGWGSIL